MGIDYGAEGDYSGNYDARAQGYSNAISGPGDSYGASGYGGGDTGSQGSSSCNKILSTLINIATMAIPGTALANLALKLTTDKSLGAHVAEKLAGLTAQGVSQDAAITRVLHDVGGADAANQYSAIQSGDAQAAAVTGEVAESGAQRSGITSGGIPTMMDDYMGKADTFYGDYMSRVDDVSAQWDDYNRFMVENSINLKLPKWTGGPEVPLAPGKWGEVLGRSISGQQGLLPGVLNAGQSYMDMSKYPLATEIDFEKMARQHEYDLAQVKAGAEAREPEKDYWGAAAQAAPGILGAIGKIFGLG